MEIRYSLDLERRYFRRKCRIYGLYYIPSKNFGQSVMGHIVRIDRIETIEPIQMLIDPAKSHN